MKNSAKAVVVGALGISAFLFWRERARAMDSGASSKHHGLTPEIQQIIAQAAKRNGVPVAVALAFADVESGFNPNQAGDVHWASLHPQKYRDLVLVKLGSNPFANRPELWHSYGLFQLLSPHFVHGDEDPRVLYRPEINAERGTAYLAHLLNHSGGDPIAARLAYVGCGFDGQACNADTASMVRNRITSALSRYQGIA